MSAGLSCPPVAVSLFPTVHAMRAAIEKSKELEMHKTSRLSEHSKQVIAKIRKDGPQTLGQLRPLVGGYDYEIRKRLSNLCTAGWLEKIEGSETKWDIRSAAASLFETGKAPHKAKKAQPPMGDFPQPRQIDVMKTTYKPEPFTPPRAGSQANQSIASRGQRC